MFGIAPDHPHLGTLLQQIFCNDISSMTRCTSNNVHNILHVVLRFGRQGRGFNNLSSPYQSECAAHRPHERHCVSAPLMHASRANAASVKFHESSQVQDHLSSLR